MNGIEIEVDELPRFVVKLPAGFLASEDDPTVVAITAKQAHRFDRMKDAQTAARKFGGRVRIIVIA